LAVFIRSSFHVYIKKYILIILINQGKIKNVKREARGVRDEAERKFGVGSSETDLKIDSLKGRWKFERR